MNESVRVEMGIQKLWRYFKFFIDWSYPVLLVIMGLFIFTSSPKVDDTIDLTKRQLLGILTITLAVVKVPRKEKKKS